MNPISSSEFEFETDLSGSPTSFTTVSVTQGYFDSKGIFQGQGMVLDEKLVIAARGSDAGKVKIEVIDTHGRKAVFVLNLKPIYQKYEIPLTAGFIPDGFDRNSIAMINFVEDRALLGTRTRDLIKIRLNGLRYEVPIRDAALDAVKQTLVEKSLNYFESSAAIDPVTGFPYDRINPDGTLDTDHKVTQPTLIGFYLQTLAETAIGNLNWDSVSPTQALQAIEKVMSQLLDLQSRYGWKGGLIPWFDLDPQLTPFESVGIGDNANLSQSLAVMVGALESKTFSGIDQTRAELVIQNAETFLSRQKAGYEAAVDPFFGVFAASVRRDNGVFDHFLDRFTTEFRGAIAFLKVRFPSIPASVWDNLKSSEANYTASSGQVIENLQSYEGSAFQYFWPLLKNNELDFADFRNALYNQFVTQTDFASRERIPGFLSASETVNKGYAGLIGIPELAENANPILADLGSTYAMASAYRIAPDATLRWLKAIMDQIPGIVGTYGLKDAARSDSEIADAYLGIDVASTLLGLAGNGAEYFAAYLRKRGLELDYNMLYDRKNQLDIAKTSVPISEAPVFYNETYSVFDQFKDGGSVNDFPFQPTSVTGVRFVFGALEKDGGLYWNLPAGYNARAKQFVISYSVTDSPTAIKIVLKNSADQEIFTMTRPVNAAAGIHKLAIAIPDLPALADVQKVFVMVDQSQTLDLKGDMVIHGIYFRELA